MLGLNQSINLDEWAADSAAVRPEELGFWPDCAGAEVGSPLLRERQPIAGQLAL
jgi:hypothetical protein